MAQTLTLITVVIFKPVAGYIARLVEYQRLFKAACVMMAVLIYPLWLGLQSSLFGSVLTVQWLMAILFGCMGGVILEALARQFPSSVRCRGMNLAYTLPAASIGGFTPLALTWMTEKTGLLMFPAFYLLFFSLLALPATFGIFTLKQW